MMTYQKSVDSSQFSVADWKRLTDYLMLLITIDRKNQKKSIKKAG